MDTRSWIRGGQGGKTKERANHLLLPFSVCRKKLKEAKRVTVTRSNTRYSMVAEALSLKPDDNVVMSVGGESSSTTTNRGKVTMIDVERWRVNLNREYDERFFGISPG